MEELIGKITKPNELKFGELYYYDDNIVIEFTDGTILKLAYWDFECSRNN